MGKYITVIKHYDEVQTVELVGSKKSRIYYLIKAWPNMRYKTVHEWLRIYRYLLEHLTSELSGIVPDNYMILWRGTNKLAS